MLFWYFSLSLFQYHFSIDKLTWLNPNNTYLSCIDGRNDAASYGTPGGDFGEWLIALETSACHRDPASLVF